MNFKNIKCSGPQRTSTFGKGIQKDNKSQLKLIREIIKEGNPQQKRSATPITFKNKLKKKYESSEEDEKSNKWQEQTVTFDNRQQNDKTETQTEFKINPNPNDLQSIVHIQNIYSMKQEIHELQRKLKQLEEKYEQKINSNSFQENKQKIESSNQQRQEQEQQEFNNINAIKSEITESPQLISQSHNDKKFLLEIMSKKMNEPQQKTNIAASNTSQVTSQQYYQTIENKTNKSLNQSMLHSISNSFVQSPNQQTFQMKIPAYARYYDLSELSTPGIKSFHKKSENMSIQKDDDEYSLSNLDAPQIVQNKIFQKLEQFEKNKNSQNGLYKDIESNKQKNNNYCPISEFELKKYWEILLNQGFQEMKISNSNLMEQNNKQISIYLEILEKTKIQQKNIQEESNLNNQELEIIKQELQNILKNRNSNQIQIQSICLSNCSQIEMIFNIFIQSRDYQIFLKQLKEYSSTLIQANAILNSQRMFQQQDQQSVQNIKYEMQSQYGQNSVQQNIFSRQNIIPQRSSLQEKQHVNQPQNTNINEKIAESGSYNSKNENARSSWMEHQSISSNVQPAAKEVKRKAEQTEQIKILYQNKNGTRQNSSRATLIDEKQKYMNIQQSFREGSQKLLMQIESSKALQNNLVINRSIERSSVLSDINLNNQRLHNNSYKSDFNSNYSKDFKFQKKPKASVLSNQNLVLNKNINQNEFDNQYKFYDSLQSPLSNNFNYSKIDRPESQDRIKLKTQFKNENLQQNQSFQHQDHSIPIKNMFINKQNKENIQNRNYQYLKSSQNEKSHQNNYSIQNTILGSSTKTQMHLKGKINQFKHSDYTKEESTSRKQFSQNIYQDEINKQIYSKNKINVKCDTSNISISMQNPSSSPSYLDYLQKKRLPFSNTQKHLLNQNENNEEHETLKQYNQQKMNEDNLNEIQTEGVKYMKQNILQVNSRNLNEQQNSSKQYVDTIGDKQDLNETLKSEFSRKYYQNLKLNKENNQLKIENKTIEPQTAQTVKNYRFNINKMKTEPSSACLPNFQLLKNFDKYKYINLKSQSKIY